MNIHTFWILIFFLSFSLSLDIQGIARAVRLPLDRHDLLYLHIQISLYTCPSLKWSVHQGEQGFWSQHIDSVRRKENELEREERQRSVFSNVQCMDISISTVQYSLHWLVKFQPLYIMFDLMAYMGFYLFHSFSCCITEIYTDTHAHRFSFSFDWCSLIFCTVYGTRILVSLRLWYGPNIASFVAFLLLLCWAHFSLVSVSVASLPINLIYYHTALNWPSFSSF